jgi:hypothetical protein
MHHVALDRARAHQCHLDHQVVEAGWLQARQHRHLGARFDLEHADRVGARDHRVSRRVLRRHVGQAEGPASPPGDGIEHATDGREHAQGEDIHFHQAQRVDVVLVPLDHGALRHRRVFHRHQAVEPAAGDDETADVLREMPWKTDQHLRDRQPALHGGIGRIEPDLGAARRQLLALFPPGQVAGQGVDRRQRKAQRAPGVAQRTPGAVGDHRRSQRGALAAVAGIDVLDHLLAPLVLEIDVDVGRLVALLRHETLEQHGGPRRVHLGDEERVAHRRIRRRAAPLAQYPLPARPGDDVMHGEEVGRVGHLGDQPQLMLDLGRHLVRHAGGVALREAILGQPAQPGIRCLAGRHHLLGVLVAQLGQREFAARGRRQGLGQQLGRVEARERQARAQVALAVGKQRMAGIHHRGLQAQRGQRILQGPARTHMHVHVAGGEQRQAQRRRQFAQRGEARAVVGPQVALPGDPGAAGEVLGQPARFIAPDRRLTSADFHRDGHPQRQAVGHAAAVPAGEVGARQQVTALFRPAPTQRHQRRQVAVAGAVAGQQHQLHAAGQGQFGAVDQFQWPAARGQVRAHTAGEAAFVGDRQR